MSILVDVSMAILKLNETGNTLNLSTMSFVVAITLETGPFLENFLGGVLSLHVPTKMGAADDRWAWSIKFAVLYTMKLWRCDKA